MHMHWIVVADSSRARIFQTGGDLDDLVEIKDLLNPKARLSDAELDRDAKGRFYSTARGTHGHTAEPRTTHEARQADKFSREVMRYLEHANEDHQFDSLVVVAPPEFLGLLRRQLNRQVEKKIRRQLAIDIAGLKAPQIRDYLKHHMH